MNFSCAFDQKLKMKEISELMENLLFWIDKLASLKEYNHTFLPLK